MVMYKHTKMNQTELYVSAHQKSLCAISNTSKAHAWENVDRVVYIEEWRMFV